MSNSNNEFSKIVNSVHLDDFYEDEIYDDAIDIVEENSIRFNSKEEEEIFIKNFLEVMEDYFNTLDKKREEIVVEDLEEEESILIEKFKKWLEEED